MPAETAKIAIYLRVSTQGQDFPAQEEPISAYCQRKGWTSEEFATYREKASSTSNTRPVLDSIITKAREGRIRTLIVYKLDRLGRSLAHLAWIIDELRRLQVNVISVTEGIDTSADNPLANMQLQMLGVFGQFEKSLIRERTISGYNAARRRGVQIGRPRIRDQFKAEAVAMKQKGKSLEEIAQKLGISVSTVWRVVKGCGAPKKIRGSDKKPRKRKRSRLSKSLPQTPSLFPGGDD